MRSARRLTAALTHKLHGSVLAIVLVIAMIAIDVSSVFIAPQHADAWMSTTDANWKKTTDNVEPGVWVSLSPTLPSNLTDSHAAIIGDYVYLFGGRIAPPPTTNVMYRAPLSNPTSWTNTGSTLPGNRGQSQLAIIGNYVYLFGGYSGSASTNTIYRAPLSNPTSWANTGATLPGALHGSQVAIIGDYAYLFGGYNGSAFTNVIYRAPVSNPTSWTNTGATLPSNLAQSQLAIIGNYVYLFGGANSSGAQDVIYRAPVSSPTSWSDTGSTLPSNLLYAQVAIIGDYVYLFGGTDIESISRVIYRAPVSDPVSWSNTGTLLPTTSIAPQLAIIGDYVYLFGASGSNKIQRAPLSAPIPPSAPGTPTFSNVTTSSMRVNWTAATGADSYKVERCQEPSLEATACIDFPSLGFHQIAVGVTDLYYDDYGEGLGDIAPDTMYRYRIRGTNTAGDGPYSGTGTQETQQQTFANCTFNGETVNHGESVTAYQSPSVPFGSSCVPESRACTDGTLSGTYQYASCAVDPPPPPPSGGVPITGWGWSDTIGWVDLNCENTDSCSTNGFGLSINPSDGTLSGYAWSDNVGWVSANASDVSGCPAAPCAPAISGNSVVGWLRALAGGTSQSGGWDGFIALGDTDAGDAIDYGVTFNSGDFEGFGWGSTNVGWVDFSGAITLYNTCTPSTVYSCNGSQTIVLTETSSSCQNTVTNPYLFCTAPQFCSVGSPVCLWPQPTGIPGSGGLTGQLFARPNLVPRNATATVYWDVSNVTNCTVTATNGTSWTGATSATSSCPTHFGTGCQSSPIVSQTMFTLSCTALDSSPYQETATVNLLPDFQER